MTSHHELLKLVYRFLWVILWSHFEFMNHDLHLRFQIVLYLTVLSTKFVVFLSVI